MAALDPTAPAQTDEENQVLRATLKLIRVPMDFDSEDEDDEEDYDPEDIEAIAARLREAGALPEEELDSSDEDSEDEKNGGPSDPVKSKKAKQAALSKKLKQDLEDDEMDIDNSLTNGVNGKGKAKATDDDISSDEDDEDDEDDEEPEEFVLCTLNPENVRSAAKTLQGYH